MGKSRFRMNFLDPSWQPTSRRLNKGFKCKDCGLSSCTYYTQATERKQNSAHIPVQNEPGAQHILPDVAPPLKFPYSIVWTPIPVLSWLLPVVGHMGICSSDGTIHDFAGPYFVNIGTLAFGNPTKYWQLDPAEAAGLVNATQTTDVRAHAKAWDCALQATKHSYQTRPYNFLTDNCHSFVARMLNQIQYASSTKWNMLLLAAEVVRHGKFVSLGGLLKTWGPFAVLMAMGLSALGIYWLAGWLLLLATVALVFLASTFFVSKDAPAVYRASSI